MSAWDLPAAALIAALIEAVLHWFPWRIFVRRDLPRPIAYMAGVLGIEGPLTWLLWAWGDLQAMAALWIVTGAAGLMVLMAYGLDWLGVKISQYQEMREREEGSADE